LQLNQKPKWRYLDFHPGNSITDIYLNICWESHSCGLEEDCPVTGWFRIYFPDDRSGRTAETRITECADMLNDTVTVVSGTIEDTGWKTAWHRFFKPVPVGEGFLIVPSWEPVTREGRIPIRIHPGQAFGTGYHASTALCLKCMETCDFTGRDILDAGCGSGVLGIAAAKLGARSVTGIDHEDEAIYEAAGNADINGIAPICRMIRGRIEDLTCRFDCFIGNLSAEFFTTNPGLLDRLVRKNGYAIVSGFTSVSCDAIRQYLVNEGFIDPIENLEQGEWTALYGRKTS
jgi:ribosomal protein L11 methyltransferase